MPSLGITALILFLQYHHSLVLWNYSRGQYQDLQVLVPMLLLILLTHLLVKAEAFTNLGTNLLFDAAGAVPILGSYGKLAKLGRVGKALQIMLNYIK